ncbi:MULTISPECIES: glycine cleavage system protein GcvH [Novosphingobium]|uniref:Glycine cleavage system H protein n=2 Tax=Novosphingobium TaxID=165696 RepID=A0ABT0AA54_9SPHN|nr:MULTISPECIES: glycine cleavage system protein GcvH [Novosphingobium]MED5545534.1 glycine cleavage system protein GcvH [Pseudomonadota bacterium]MCJ1960080.1 glycine cleavage system protein GcvH [Novosphingobium mangrovi (ex Hu et al. 2023)]QVM82855.1 glycine cleavage system protein GcvH [Novosphingobium decolorationis]TYC86801.1 glycine cleavage system protein GcvH [Novosphingobium sp. BW1]GAM06462.1 glycine cleavage system protein H [Novosphingobium sp. MBES04]
MSVYYSEDHEWIEVEGDLGTVGITDYAQGQLGDITFVDLPEEGATVAKGDSIAVVDSVKAASDVYTPVSGEIAETNDALADEPELVNSDPEVGGWLFRVKLADASELEELMDEAAYKKFVAGL